MKSIINNMIRILLATCSVLCLKYSEPLCSNNAETPNAKYNTFDNENRLVFAHVIFRHGERNIGLSQFIICINAIEMYLIWKMLFFQRNRIQMIHTKTNPIGMADLAH